MPFTASIKERSLVSCARHCCICHRFCGIKMELHHIKQRNDGGKDTFENCIPLCLDCHADMKSYDHKHPKGTKYTPKELIAHRDHWYSKAKNPIPLSYGDRQLLVDQSIYEKFMRVLPYDPCILALEETRYTAADDADKFSGLFRNFFVISNEPRSEFIDPEIESMKSDLYFKTNSFYCASNSWKRKFANPKGDLDELNTYAQKLIDDALRIVAIYRIFVRTCRSKLGVE
jgi:hypothetical protein